jgi:hypothetical protein
MDRRGNRGYDECGLNEPEADAPCPPPGLIRLEGSGDGPLIGTFRVSTECVFGNRNSRIPSS